jgi:nucleoid DNA-binding protein
MGYLNDKPESMTVKEWLIKRQAVRTGTNIDVLRKVVNFQFEEALKALDCRVSNNNSVEISGFGKFVFSTYKANKKLIKYESVLALYMLRIQDPSLTPVVRRNLEMRIETTGQVIKELKTKLGL